MCGLVGIVGTSAVNQRIYDALTVLQHRGQDAAGIMTMDEHALFVHKDAGLVRDVFGEEHMRQLVGNAGIGHVRYPTAGCDGADEAQPFYVNAPFGIGLGHNGNLTNAEELARTMVEEDRRHLNTRSDSEVLLNVFASELQRSTAAQPAPADVFRAIEGVFRRCRGGYAVVMMIVGHGVAGFRDPHGIRPLVLGKRKTARGIEWMLASESVALDMLGFTLERDVGAGRGDLHRHARPHARAAVRAGGPAHALHLRVRLLRAAGLDHRQHLRAQGAHAHGREAGREDPAPDARPRHRRRDPDPGHEPDQRAAARARARREVPRGLRQEPLHRPHLHHAGAGDAPEVGARQAERDRPRVPRPQRAAGRRLDRARHDVGADHRARARGRRAQGVLRLGRAAGALPERLRHRHGRRLGTGGERAQRGGRRGRDRRRLARLPGPGRPRQRLPARRRAHHGVRHLLFLGRVRDRAT